MTRACDCGQPDCDLYRLGYPFCMACLDHHKKTEPCETYLWEQQQ